MENISRKEAIQKTAMLLGFAVSGSLISSLLSGCESVRDETWKPTVLSKEQFEVVEDFAEVLLPRTDTPGAKDAMIGRFMDHLLEGYLSNLEKDFLIKHIDKLAKNGFAVQAFDLQHQMVKSLIEEDEDGRMFFRRFKQLVMLGFFSSEAGATRVLSYDEIPGIFSGCLDLDEAGGRTWAL